MLDDETRMKNIEQVINYLNYSIEEEEATLSKLEAQLTAGLPLNVYLGYCLEIERCNGKIIGLEEAGKAMRGIYHEQH